MQKDTRDQLLIKNKSIRIFKIVSINIYQIKYYIYLIKAEANSPDYNKIAEAMHINKLIQQI